MHIKILCKNVSTTKFLIFQPITAQSSIRLKMRKKRTDKFQTNVDLDNAYCIILSSGPASKIYFQGFECIEIALTPVLRGLVLVPVEYFGLDEDSEDNADIDEDDLINYIKVIFDGKAILN